MASNFLNALSLIFCTLSFIIFSQNSNVNSVPLHSSTSDKVPVAIYYQSLGSTWLFDEDLPKISKMGLFSIIDLHLCPWGNSRIVTKDPFTFICQHGELECKLNTIEACAIYTWPDVDKHFSFIKCVESLVSKNETTKWESCYSILKYNRKPIDECYKSGLGKELERKNAEETAALKPPHAFTPWTVVAGEPIIVDFANIAKYICKAYKGSSPPEACKNLPIVKSDSNEPKKIHVNYKAKTKGARFTRSKMIIKA